MQDAPSENPLGPRDAGQIVNDTFRLYLRHFPKIVVIGGLAYIFAEIVAELVVPVPAAPARGPAYRQWLLDHAPAQILRLYLVLIAASFSAGALIHAVSERHVQGEMNIGRAFGRAWRRWVTLIAADVLVMTACTVVAITIIGVPYAIYLGVRWSLSREAVMLERASALSALSRSAERVRGQWWRVFGVKLLILFISLTVSVFLSLVPQIGDILGAVLGTPVFVIGSLLLYYDLRARRDGYGLPELAGALGLGVVDESARQC